MWWAVVACGAEPLRWGADAEGGAPFIFKDPADPERNIGFEVDLIAALSGELQQPITFHQYNFVNLVNGLERGDFDFAMNGLEVTPDRARHVRFSRPYYIYRLQLVARRGETRFANLAELGRQGLTVGTLDETAASRLLQQQGVPARLYDSQLEPYQDLILGRVDAVLLDWPVAVYYAKPRPELQFVGEPLAEGHYAIAFPRNQEPLAARCDTALLKLSRNGKLEAIYRKWNIWTDDQQRLAEEKPPELPPLLADLSGEWRWTNYFPLLLRAALVTVQISVLSMALAVALGLPVALGRLYGPPPIRWAAIAYVEFFRGLPVLLLLYLLYYGIPSILDTYAGEAVYKPGDLTVAVVAFGLNYAAYEAEIYRAGLASIPHGQWEAAASLGMSPVLTFRRVILPQAIRVILPPMTNDFVALFKDTSLVSAIGLIELTKQYQILSKSSLRYLEIGVWTAVLYLAMSVPLGHLARRLERRWGKGE